MEIKKVGVLGCGLMGSGIAQTAASAGFETVVREVSEELLQKGFAGIQKSLSKFAEKISELKSSIALLGLLTCRLRKIKTHRGEPCA